MKNRGIQISRFESNELGEVREFHRKIRLDRTGGQIVARAKDPQVLSNEWKGTIDRIRSSKLWKMTIDRDYILPIGCNWSQWKMQWSAIGKENFFREIDNIRVRSSLITISTRLWTVFEYLDDFVKIIRTDRYIYGYMVYRKLVHAGW